MSSENNRGFTLVELLVVISIIALLLSILMPTLAKAREQAQAVLCSARLKQINVAYSLYVIDNKTGCLGFTYGGTPLQPGWKLCGNNPYARWNGWYDYGHGLAGYLGLGSSDSTSADRKKIKAMLYCSKSKNVQVSHATSYAVSQYFGFDALLGEQVKRTSDTVMLMDGISIGPYTGNPRFVYFTSPIRYDNRYYPLEDGGPTDIMFQGIAKKVHYDSANFLFFDGHVKNQKWLGSVKAYRDKWIWNGPLPK